MSCASGAPCAPRTRSSRCGSSPHNHSSSLPIRRYFMVVFSTPCAHDVHMVLQASSQLACTTRMFTLVILAVKAVALKLVRTRKPALFCMPAEADMQVCNKQLWMQLSLS